MSKINSEVKTTSIKRINANRENAKKSTGPKTTNGKFRSCRNALKHGLDSRKHLIIGEDLKEFEEMKESYIKMFEPSNILEVEECMQIIAMSWKIRRFSVVETGLYNHPMTVYGLHAMKTRSDAIRPPMTTPLTMMASVPTILDETDRSGSDLTQAQ